MNQLLKALRLQALVVVALVAPYATAGIFDLPKFVEPGSFAVGIEPEVAISNGTGAGINFKPKYGYSDWLNWQLMLGTGAGARKFRIGTTAQFEWFPDIENQPGIATGFFADYYRIESDGLFSFGVKPMFYKTFQGAEAHYTPFVGVPLGWGVRDGNFKGMVQVAIGSIFKVPSHERWRFVGEFGFNVTNAYSYISGGVSYYH